MKVDLYSRATKLFKKTEKIGALKEEIEKSERIFQFDPSDEKPFYIRIKQGKLSFGKGKKCPPDFQGGLYITGDRESLDSLFQGKLSLAESIYHHKIHIPGYRTKEPVMVWFSKLLRKGRGEK